MKIFILLTLFCSVHIFSKGGDISDETSRFNGETASLTLNQIFSEIDNSERTIIDEQCSSLTKTSNTDTYVVNSSGKDFFIVINAAVINGIEYQPSTCLSTTTRTSTPSTKMYCIAYSTESLENIRIDQKLEFSITYSTSSPKTIIACPRD